ncbi:MAG: V-type ATPase subunit [Thiotrichaceae bacterium]
MSMITEYAYLNARVSALSQTLISHEQLTDLLQQPVGQLHLGMPNFDEVLNDATLDLTRLEQLWFNNLINEFSILIRPLFGKARDFLIYWLHKAEVNNLKVIVRGKLSSLSVESISKQITHLGNLASLPFEQLIRAEDINELLRQLDNTAYITITRQARRSFEQQQQLYVLDAAIDRYYLQALTRQMDALPAVQREYLLPLLTSLLNKFNILWLLRYRFSYNLSAAETYYLLIPSNYGISRTQLQNLAELSNLTDVIAQLPESIKLIIAEASSIFEIEQQLNRAVERCARKTLRRQNFTLAKVFAYILLRELEMRRVLAIIQGKRLQLPPELIVSTLDFV